MKIRIKFRKHGPVRFIGHLDIMRYFQKALRRADIDVAYTNGFSPHQIMTFASPLGVGLESNGEYMDIECNSVTDSRSMAERINAAGAPGLEVLSVKLLPEKAGNAMASVAAASYTVRFREGRTPLFLQGQDMRALIGRFLARGEIIVSRETKKGVRDVDIRPGIYEMTANADGSLFLLVDASSAGNLKPGSVMDAFCEMFGEPLAENALAVTREDIYTDLGTPEARRLVSLGDIGTPVSGSDAGEMGS